MTHIYNNNNVYKNRFKLEAQTHLLMTQTIMPVSWTSQGLQQQLLRSNGCMLYLSSL